jgi:hypothetical protein
MFNRPIEFVAASFGLTLETLAFISPMPATEPLEAPGEAVLVRLPLTGGDLSEIQLVAGRRFGKLVAANLLGTSTEDPEVDQRCEDGLKELMNIAGGALLANSGDGEAIPEMGIPEVEQFAAASDWEPFVSSPDVCIFDAEGNTIALRMRSAA